MTASNIEVPMAVSSHQQMPPQPNNVATPSSKRDLVSWWKAFKKRKDEDKVPPPVGIFGVPLHESIKYANVAISLTNEHCESYVYGYVPIVIAKCGVFLKEKATDVEGIFRLNGAAKRIKELQVAFDSPDRYGKGLDWTGYTVHDAANILRRYLNQLPQPIVPLEFYERFRDPLRNHQAQAVGDMEAQAQDVGDFNHEAAISTYQKLITELPPLNRQLLLYILDLLAVFASKSEINRMTSPNLAAIFQPGMLSHPAHDMRPSEYRLSQDVIIFLIENQDSFLVGMSGTAADEKTVKEVQSGVQRQTNTPTRLSQAGLGRSASNASAGADSLRKQGGIRRNVSVSSKNSRASSNNPSPGSPAPGSPLLQTASSGGVHRSNTVPSKKSPGISSARFRNIESSTPTSSKLTTPSPLTPTARGHSPTEKASQASEPHYSSINTPGTPSSGLHSVPESKESRTQPPSAEKVSAASEKLSLRTSDQGFSTTITGGVSGTPTSRGSRAFFSKSPSSDAEKKEPRHPNKLRKKRAPGTSPNASAQSSTHSLHGAPESPAGQTFYTPLPTPGASAQLSSDPLSSAAPILSNIEATPSSENPPHIGEMDKLSAFYVSQPGSTPGASPTMKPTKSPIGSLHSRNSFTEDPELDHMEESVHETKESKKHRWTLTASSKNHEENRLATASNSQLGANTAAKRSTTTVNSEGRPRKSITVDPQQAQVASIEASTGPAVLHSSNESTPAKEKDAPREKDSSAEDKTGKGPIGWFKGKVAKAKEERKEREAEKERAKSPLRSGSDHTTSKLSFGATTPESVPMRGRSTDAIAEASREKESDVPAAAPRVPDPSQQ